jgi:hypothetical protein
MLDHAARVDEVEGAVVEGEPPRRVGAHERPRVVGPVDEVDAGDVEVRLERAQAEPAAADVEDARARARAGQRPEAPVTACTGTRGERRAQPRPQAGLGGRVDVRAGLNRS